MVQPFETAKKAFTLCSGLPLDRGTSWPKRSLCIIFTIVAFLSQMCAICAHIGFVVKFISINLEQSLFAISAIIILFSIAYIILVGLFLRPKMLIIFENLSEIHEKSMNLILVYFILSSFFHF